MDELTPDAESVNSQPEAERARDSVAAHLAALVPSYLEVLNGREREVFELGDLRGLNATEIAERFGVQAVTVRTQLMRARRKIRLRMLEEHSALLEDYKP